MESCEKKIYYIYKMILHWKKDFSPSGKADTTLSK